MSQTQVCMPYSENHALDSAMLPIPRIKEIEQLTNENRQVQRD